MNEKNHTIKSFNPATGEFLGEVPITTLEEIDGVVSKAKQASESWTNTSFKERAEFLLLMRDIIFKRSEEIADLIVAEVGKPKIEAMLAEVFGVLDGLTYYAKNAERLLSDKTFRLPRFRGGSKTAITFQPMGVVAIIAPWNYPFYICLNGIMQSLITGNTVVLKPSDRAPLVGEKIKEILSEVGLPKGVVSIVQGDGEIGKYLIKSDVNKILFTGSVATGKKIMRDSAERLHSITLELGGSDPALILSDARLDRASSGVVWGRFFNAGQSCCAVKRVYVVEDIASEFIDEVVSKVKEIRIGNGMDPKTEMGPLIDRRQLNTVQDQVEDAKSKGAEILCGGKQLKDLGELFYAPTILVNVNPSMRVLKEEVFGPVLPIVTVKNEEEGILQANNTDFGLGASVWTRDINRGWKIAKRLQAGTVWVNNVMVMAPQMPWKGIKYSGLGQTSSYFGLLDFTNIKTICVSHGKKEREDHWYPYPESILDFFRNTIRLSFSSHTTERLKALIKVMRREGLR